MTPDMKVSAMLRADNRVLTILAITVVTLILAAHSAVARPDFLRGEWPRTDFSKHSVELSEIRSGGPPKDGIPSIDTPRFEQLAHGAVRGWSSRIADTEPVISLVIGGDA